MTKICRDSVDRVFEGIAHAMAGEQTEVAFAALASALASSASALAANRDEAFKILDAINTDALAMIRADFDYFRAAAEHVGARQ